MPNVAVVVILMLAVVLVMGQFYSCFKDKIRTVNILTPPSDLNLLSSHRKKKQPLETGWGSQTFHHHPMKSQFMDTACESMPMNPSKNLQL